MAATIVRAKPARSGRQVAGTAFAAGSVTSLLAPWITEWVRVVSLSTGVQLDMAYSDQVLGLSVAIVTWIASQVKMLWIDHQDGQADTSAGELEDVRSALFLAESEIDRLKRERTV